MTPERRKIMAATVAAVTASVLAVAKLIVGFLTGSLAILATAVDSLMDVACSGLNAYFLRIAAEGPDDEHAFGHGKAEALSGVIQATIISLGGVWLIGRGVRRLLSPEVIASPGAGMTVTAAALAVSLALVWYLRREARATQSIALHADAFHYVTDIATNTVAGGALLIYRFTGWQWVDPVASLLIALYIIRASIDILREAADELLDRGLPRSVEDEVKTMLKGFAPEVRGYRSFRSRRAGGTQFFEFDLLVERSTTFERAHDLAETAVNRIRERHGRDTQVMVHTDPV
jgi:ferrous-iron efflux pump FieF